MSTILVLKPIIDALYEDVREYKEKMEKRVKELEAEVASLKVKRKRPVVAPSVVVIEDSDDDECFAEAALAPPASSLAPVSVPTQVEKQKETKENPTTTQEDTKTVKMIGGKDAKEYMKEYQRSYRKKQKDITLNL
jgi:trans-2-enoyl-CoA reductase